MSFKKKGDHKKNHCHYHQLIIFSRLDVRLLLFIHTADFRGFLRRVGPQVTLHREFYEERRVGCRCTRIILRSRSRRVVFFTSERRSTHSSVVSDDETHARPPVVLFSLDSMAVNDTKLLPRLFPSAFVFIRMSFVV